MSGCTCLLVVKALTFVFARSHAGIGLSICRLTDGTQRAYTSNWDKPRRRLLYYRGTIDGMFLFNPYEHWRLLRALCAHNANYAAASTLLWNANSITPDVLDAMRTLNSHGMTLVDMEGIDNQ